MLEIIVTVIVGLIGGVAVGFQSPLSGIMSEKVGGTSSSFIIHLSGAILSALLLVTRGGEKISEWRSLPWYTFGLGACGVVLYLTLSHTIPRLGATNAVALIIVGQLGMGLLIDTFGWFGVVQRPLDLTRVVAIGLLLVGSYLMVK
jgi:bacterial/archaeal transporter family-2 protein